MNATTPSFTANLEAKSNPTLAERELVITRTIDAPRALVFQAWTDPHHLAQWWGPKGFTNPVCKIDAQVGGRLDIVMRAPDGNEYPMTGVIREIVPPELFVFTNIALDKDGNAIIEGLTRVSFSETDGKTSITLETRAVALAPEAVAMLQGMERGWTQSIDRLVEQVQTRASPPVADRELVITRVFDAPRSFVFKAWTDAEHSRHWSGPRGFTATHIEGDLRPGGAWRLCLRRDETGEELWQGGIYQEIVEPELLVYTFAWDRDDGTRGHETLVRIALDEHDGKTTMTFRQAAFDSVAQRDGHRSGWNSAFDRLAEYATENTLAGRS